MEDRFGNQSVAWIGIRKAAFEGSFFYGCAVAIDRRAHRFQRRFSAISGSISEAFRRGR